MKKIRGVGGRLGSKPHTHRERGKGSRKCSPDSSIHCQTPSSSCFLEGRTTSSIGTTSLVGLYPKLMEFWIGFREVGFRGRGGSKLVFVIVMMEEVNPTLGANVSIFEMGN